MKLLRVILVVLELGFLFSFVSPPFVESHPLAGAIVAYSKNPTPENRSELERQRELRRDAEFRQKLFYAVLLAVNSVGLFYVSRRINRRLVA